MKKPQGDHHHPRKTSITLRLFSYEKAHAEHQSANAGGDHTRKTIATPSATNRTTEANNPSGRSQAPRRSLPQHAHGSARIVETQSRSPIIARPNRQRIPVSSQAPIRKLQNSTPYLVVSDLRRAENRFSISSHVS